MSDINVEVRRYNYLHALLTISLCYFSMISRNLKLHDFYIIFTRAIEFKFTGFFFIKKFTCFFLFSILHCLYIICIEKISNISTISFQAFLN